MRLMRTDLEKKEILVRVKYKINSYKIGFSPFYKAIYSFIRMKNISTNQVLDHY